MNVHVAALSCVVLLLCAVSMAASRANTCIPIYCCSSVCMFQLCRVWCCCCARSAWRLLEPIPCSCCSIVCMFQLCGSAAVRGQHGDQYPVPVAALCVCFSCVVCGVAAVRGQHGGSSRNGGTGTGNQELGHPDRGGERHFPESGSGQRNC